MSISFNHSVALAILRSSISVACFTSFPEPLKLSKVVHFNLLTCIFWQRTTCRCGICPLRFTSVSQGGGGSDGWKTVTSFLAAVSVAWRKNGRPSAPGTMGGNLHMVATSFPSPHLLFILEKQPQSINPSVLLSEQRTKGLWQPVLWSSYSRFLEAGPVFGILTQVLSSDEIPFAWPWWFWLQFSDNQVCYEQRTEERIGIEGRKLSNTSIESNTALSKHWPLLEWIICNNPLWLPNIHWLCKLGLPKFELRICQWFPFLLWLSCTLPYIIFSS